VIVDGVNVAKRHQRRRTRPMQGGIIDKDMPLHVSNVAIVCTSCGKHTRIGYRFDGADEGARLPQVRKGPVTVAATTVRASRRGTRTSCGARCRASSGSAT
jgi:ribosomal protein L24